VAGLARVEFFYVYFELTGPELPMRRQTVALPKEWVSAHCWIAGFDFEREIPAPAAQRRACAYAFIETVHADRIGVRMNLYFGDQPVTGGFRGFVRLAVMTILRPS